MADQDRKTGGLNRGKYVILKPCIDCSGSGTVCGCGAVRSLDDCVCIVGKKCETCRGLGAVKTAPEARYFVLRIDCGPDGPHDPNARAALYTYADRVAEDNIQFADEIRGWLDETLTYQAEEAKP